MGRSKAKIEIFSTHPSDASPGRRLAYPLHSERNVHGEAGRYVDALQVGNRHVRLVVNEDLQAGQRVRPKVGRTALNALVALHVQEQLQRVAESW